MIGPYGCGKSSLLRLVLYQLRQKTKMRIWVCVVEGWGLENGDTADAYILRRAVTEISRHVDAVALAGIPLDYKLALSGAGDLWGNLGSVVSRGADDPSETLQRLDRVLKAVGARLIIFLEDLDRNSAPGCSRMLHLRWIVCGRLQNLSLILAVAPSSGIDFARLCRSVEMPPQLDTSMVSAGIDMFREICSGSLGSWFSDIDPAGYGDRKAFTTLRREGMPGTVPGEVVSVISAMTSLVSTPRQFKKVLQQTWEDWGRVHGEVDLDDLIILNTLRIGRRKHTTISKGTVGS